MVSLETIPPIHRTSKRYCVQLTAVLAAFSNSGFSNTLGQPITLGVPHPTVRVVVVGGGNVAAGAPNPMFAARVASAAAKTDCGVGAGVSLA